MKKRDIKPGAMLSPVPVVMVSCGDMDGEKNIITIAWSGVINSNPPLVYVSIRKERYSHKIIKDTGEFVINFCDESLTFATDYCGVRSGEKVDKFKEQGLTPVGCKLVKCPAIEQSPVNLECKVREIISYPSHDMFVGEIVNMLVNEDIINKNGRIDLGMANLVAYVHGEYFGIKKEAIGRFGYSVMKPKTKRKLSKKNKEKRRMKRKDSKTL